MHPFPAGNIRFNLVQHGPPPPFLHHGPAVIAANEINAFTGFLGTLNGRTAVNHIERPVDVVHQRLVPPMPQCRPVARAWLDGNAVDGQFRHGRTVLRDDRATARLRLGNGQAKALAHAWGKQHIGCAVQVGNVAVGHAQSQRVLIAELDGRAWQSQLLNQHIQQHPLAFGITLRLQVNEAIRVCGMEVAKRFQRLGKRLAAGLSLIGSHHQHHERILRNAKLFTDGLLVAGAKGVGVNAVGDVVARHTRLPHHFHAKLAVHGWVFCPLHGIHHGWRRGTAVYGKQRQPRTRQRQGKVFRQGPHILQGNKQIRTNGVGVCARVTTPLHFPLAAVERHRAHLQRRLPAYRPAVHMHLVAQLQQHIHDAFGLGGVAGKMEGGVAAQQDFHSGLFPWLSSVSTAAISPSSNPIWRSVLDLRGTSATAVMPASSSLAAAGKPMGRCAASAS